MFRRGPELLAERPAHWRADCLELLRGTAQLRHGRRSTLKRLLSSTFPFHGQHFCAAWPRHFRAGCLRNSCGTTGTFSGKAWNFGRAVKLILSRVVVLVLELGLVVVVVAAVVVLLLLLLLLLLLMMELE